MHINFFISDGKFVVLRMKSGLNHKYAQLIENENFARILKKYFFNMWEGSLHMSPWVNSKLEDGSILIETLIALSNTGNRQGFLTFLNTIENIDRLKINTPTRYREKGFQIEPSKYGIGRFSNKLLEFYQNTLKNIFTPEKFKVSDVHQLKNLIEENRPIDYQKFSHAFFTQFFLANYYKSRHALDNIPKIFSFKEDSTILDLGGGGGSSSIALVDYIQSNNGSIKSLEIVDKSKNQLKITKTALKDLDLSTTFIEQDAFDFLKQKNETYDIIFAGNFLCETITSENSNHHLSKILDSLKNGGYFLVVERLESGVYELLDQFPQLTRVAYYYPNKRFTLPTKSRHFLEDLNESTKSDIGNFVKTEYTLRYAIYQK